ncbi:MAG: D-aminoacyl-tRNA deacylase [Gammaproteobacteria bacterium]
MIALLQRVARACVSVAGTEVAAIGTGLLVFVAVEPGDTDAQVERLLVRLLAYRIFPDAQGRMNLDIRTAGGSLLLVPQFTLAADTRKGNRPSFTSTASPELGERLFRNLCARAQRLYPRVAVGVFGAHMQVELVNNGPVTFWLRVAARQS